MVSNPMIPYQKEKIENAICFFAKEHRKKARKPLYQTFLYKYLAFLDFVSLRETGQPALGLRYRAMGKGPVPIEIYDKRQNYSTHQFKFVNDQENRIVIVPRGDPDLDYFSPYEIKLMGKLIEIYAKSYIPTRLVSDASHQEIAAWRKAWKTKPNSIIDYASEFPDDMASKADGECSCPQEHFVISRALDSLEK
jgi:hypothetical protein